MKNWLKKCSVALLVFSMIGTTMPVYAADAPAAKTQTTTEDQTVHGIDAGLFAAHHGPDRRAEV